MEHICQLTNVMAKSKLLKPFIELILTVVLIWMVFVRFLNSAIISIWTKKLLIEESIPFLIQNVPGLIVVIGKNT